MGVDVGDTVGPYALEGLLGRGGMGEVWRAYDTRRERAVALKLLSETTALDPENRARFEREARMTARLESVHVIPIHDFGEVDGRLFVDMRLIAAGDLARTVRESPGGLPVRRAVDIVGQIADALDAAHGAGLVHRDVKPSNVLLGEHRGTDFCYLVDFGIARLVGPAAQAGLTETGTVLGTTAYMAPELFSGEQATPRSDVYALGCVFYELLTGSRPYPGPDAVTHMAQHVTASIPAPSHVRAELATLDTVIATALAKDPQERFSDAGTLAAEAARAVAPSAQPTRSPAGVPGAAAGAVAPAPPAAQPAPRGPATGPGGRAPSATGAAFTAAPPADGATTPTRPGPPRSLTGMPAPQPAGTRQVTGPPPPSGPPAHLPPPPPAAVPSRGRRVGVWIGAAVAALVIIAGSVVGVNAYLTSTGAPAALTATPVGGGPVAPRWVEVSPDGARVYVTGLVAAPAAGTRPEHIVRVVDAASGAASTTFGLGTFPGDLALSRDGSRLWVTERGTDAEPGTAVVVLDAANGAVLNRIEVAPGPSGIALTPDGRFAYVAEEGTNAAGGSSVAVVDTASASVVATVPVGLGPTRVAVSPDGRTVLVANEGVRTAVGNTVSVIDTATNTVRATVTVGQTPRGIAFRPDGEVAYVANQGSLENPGGSVSVIDTASNAVTATLTQDINGPVGLDTTADGRNALVTNVGSDPAPGSTVTLLDTADTSVAGIATVGTKPFAVATTPDGGRAYVTTGGEFWAVDLPE